MLDPSFKGRRISGDDPALILQPNVISAVGQLTNSIHDFKVDLFPSVIQHTKRFRED